MDALMMQKTFNNSSSVRLVVYIARTTINLPGTDNWNYKAEDIVLLTDDATNPRQIPTRQNIIEAMHWLVNGAHPHDSLFFHCKFFIRSWEFGICWSSLSVHDRPLCNRQGG